jgi:dTDP-4-dehydrorhamnose 3,5-epimerase
MYSVQGLSFSTSRTFRGHIVMKIEQTPLAGVLLIKPKIFEDSRGRFCELWNQKTMSDFGVTGPFVQDNFSVSAKNVLRGIHYQIDQPQGKLVRVAFGEVLDVAVDLRCSSPTFGKHFATTLTEAGGETLWIPEGFGHGFLALSERVGFLYKVTNYYSPAGERTIAWDDPDLSIQWPVDSQEIILSGKDRAGARLAQAEVFA